MSILDKLFPKLAPVYYWAVIYNTITSDVTMLWGEPFTDYAGAALVAADLRWLTRDNERATVLEGTEKEANSWLLS